MNKTYIYKAKIKTIEKELKIENTASYVDKRWNFNILS